VGLLVLVTLLVSVILHWQFYMTPEYQEITRLGG
jgi:hypothetical protein